MTYLKRTAFYAATAILLAIAAAFLVSTTVISQSNISDKVLMEYEHEQMKQYTKELRTYLADLGYINSGITLTRTTYPNGTNTYTAQIHHSRIEKMNETERETLKLQLTQITPPITDATVYHEFLVLNY